MVGQRLKLLRSAKGLTQREVAEALGIPKNTYAHYEDGSNEPKISILVKISMFYNISVDWLIGNELQSDSPPVNDKWEAIRKILENLPEKTVVELLSYAQYLEWRVNQKK